MYCACNLAWAQSMIWYQMKPMIHGSNAFKPWLQDPFLLLGGKIGDSLQRHFWKVMWVKARKRKRFLSCLIRLILDLITSLYYCWTFWGGELISYYLFFLFLFPLFMWGRDVTWDILSHVTFSVFNGLMVQSFTISFKYHSI